MHGGECGRGDLDAALCQASDAGRALEEAQWWRISPCMEDRRVLGLLGWERASRVLSLQRKEALRPVGVRMREEVRGMEPGTDSMSGRVASMLVVLCLFRRSITLESLLLG